MPKTDHRKQLTKTKVESLWKKPAKKGTRYQVMDSLVPGFGVRVTDKGACTYIFRKRFPGSKDASRREIGDAKVMDLTVAREKARGWDALIKAGIDPADQERHRAEKTARERANSFDAVFDDFCREKLASERRGGEVERDMRKEFGRAWKGRPIVDLSEDDVLTVITAAKRRGAASQARNLLGYARRFFDWAIDQRVYSIRTNPCLSLKPSRLIGPKLKRDRVLSDDEVFAFWRATGRMPFPFGPLYRLLLLTGLRLNEAADARWREFDSRNGVWVVPALRMKGEGGAREHVVPITDDIYAVLKSLPELTKGDYLFSTNLGVSPAWVTAKVKARLDRRMLRTMKALTRKRGGDPGRIELDHWVNHDLRRTLRTGLSALRVDRDVREAVLAHKLQGVEAIYDRYDFLTEKRDALHRWAGRVWSMGNPDLNEDNVISLPMRA